MTDLKAAALWLAAAGVPVFPCGADKSPRTPRGFHDATTDAETITAWTWDGMIGAAIAPGTFVLDVDPRNGGDRTLAVLAEQGRALPLTRTVRTGGGGVHYRFTVPEGVKLRGTLGPGVDVKRAGKGYVIAPPSPGYTFIRGGPMAPAPEWLVEELAVPEVDPGDLDAAGGAKFFPFESGTPYGVAAIERELGRLITAQEGGRNDALNRSAFALAQLAAGGELSEEAARDALDEAAGRIGLEPAESRATIASGWKAGEAEPRQAPDVKAEKPNLPNREDERPDPEAEDDEAGYFNEWECEDSVSPVEFFCYPLLPKQAVVLAFGESGAAKSLALVMLLAQGSHRGLRSTVYSLENQPPNDRERLLRSEPARANFRLTNRPLDLNDPRQVAALIRRERDWGDGRGSDVIVIDTYTEAFSTYKSEDGNARAIAFYYVVRHVLREVGCTVVVVDHTGFSGDEPRDASAKRQKVDMTILMRKSGTWQFGQPARFTMRSTKAERFGNPFSFVGEIRDVVSRKVDVGGNLKPAMELGWTNGAPRWEDA